MKIHKQITPETWTKGQLARDKYYQPVRANNPTACKWCANGWIYKVYTLCKIELTNKQKEILMKHVKARTLAEWNDAPNRTFDEVKAAFKKADL